MERRALVCGAVTCVRLISGDGSAREALTVPEYRYEVIIFGSDEDRAFIAEVPELAGCMADGLTYAEALRNVEQVIQEWIETATELGRTIPEPKGRLRFA